MFQIHIRNKAVYRQNVKKYNQKIYFYKAGEIFEPEEFNEVDILYDILKYNRLTELSKAKGEFCFLIESEKYLYVINSEVGIIRWYYYIDNDTFFISNDFWSIVKEIKPNIENIDKQSIYESIILSKSLNSNTFIKGIKYIEGGEVLIFDKNTHKLNRKIYTTPLYIENKNLLKNKIEVFDEIDNLFKLNLNKIRKFNENIKIGVTISGGLDSRFPLPYLKKDEVVSTYLIGSKNNLFTPLDFDNAKNMANMYNFDFNMIDPFEIDISYKAMIDILKNPSTNSNIMKALDYNRNFNKSFNILLTGAYGGLIGGRVLDKSLLEFNSSSDFIYSIFHKYSMYALFNYYNNKNSLERKTFITKLNKLKNIFLDKDVRVDYKESINEFLDNNFLISNDIKYNIFESLSSNLIDLKNNSINQLSTVMKFHLSFHSIRGAFESLHGQVKAYSIYNPYIYEYSKQWPIEFLQSRSIMEEFLLNKYPNLAGVPLQSYNLPIPYRYREISSIYKNYLKSKYIFMFKLKGLAINYTTWWSSINMQHFIQKVFEKDSYFYELFNKNDINSIMNTKNYTHLADNLLKTKLLIDTIEFKNYEKFQDNLATSEKY